MHDSLPLITTIATALGVALIMGFIAVKLKLPTLVGYLLAGIMIGPFTPGFVANAEIAAELAEIGVMLLMFGVGLHFSMDHLLKMRNVALPGAIIQIIVASCLGGGLAMYWGWGLGGALVFGLSLSVASTVVLIRALESQGILNSINGQIAISWLIVEDLAMVLVLVLLPVLSGWLGGNTVASADENIWILLIITLFKICVFIGFMWVMGRSLLSKLLLQIARTGSRELFTLCVIAAAVSIAFAASKIFGMSFALGAFFAGMIMRESSFSRRAAEESLPFRDAFAVLFFVAVGMLFNPYIFIEQPLHVLAVVGIILVGKSIAAAALVLILRYPLNTALIVSASLAQIGEFSFILAGLGVHLGLLPEAGRGLILAGALISITLNPFIFKVIEPVLEWMRSKFKWVRELENMDDPLLALPMSTDAKYLSGQVVLVGYGRVGKRIERSLSRLGMPFVVVEQNRELVQKLRERKLAAVLGDASDPNTLVQAHIARAGMLVIALSDTFKLKQMVDIANTLNPQIEIIIRAPYVEDALLLKRVIPGKFFYTERELANGMTRHIMKRFGVARHE